MRQPAKLRVIQTMFLVSRHQGGPTFLSQWEVVSALQRSEQRVCRRTVVSLIAVQDETDRRDGVQRKM